ncbi:ricin-type beta-trefoil lectin domain protein [Streptomyces sp. NPDC001678]|uniref:ricin-type beta-trefoil lectin domain protein n=1 Tax=Streptomyces sp. NPDC001678 TaxID=3364599 RepID=UPI0036A90ED8
MANKGFCLAMWPDSPQQGHVYIEPCSSPVNYYQQWYEKWDGKKFNLVNRQTGMCLDSGNGNGWGEVYAMKCNGGDYQRWR